ncbi:MAG: hypothetical protein CME62_03805 [Halobacteriovoraceae bacterium]|nr:hypothetical protein [Halobacteriovoraceae bacterium]|tara:strand:+ start:13818 stop:14282 length:465 start_codon:yes stop_codon:yes gene_type:complete
MQKKQIRSWKKVFVDDLNYVSYELKDIVAKPAVIFLEGELGAGKTTFSKNFHNDPEGSSPTYSLINEHKDILHADFYRVKEREDIIHLELPLYLEDKNFLLIEWGFQHLSNIMPEIPDSFSYYVLEIHVNDKENREKTDQFSRDFQLYSLKLDF